MFSTSKLFYKPAAASPAGDVSFSYVALLLEPTSTNGQQNNTFLDSSTNNFTITRNGTPTQGSSTPYWPDGYWSWYFNGSGFNQANTSVSVIPSTSSTFTIECWIFPTATTVGANPSVVSDSYSASIYWGFGTTTSNTIQFAWTDAVGGKTCTGNTVVSLNTWTHIAVSVNANSISMYVNGVVQTLTGTTTLTNRSSSINQCVIGYVQTGSSYFIGYISNLSVLNGTAKYSAAFTPSTTPLSVSATNQTLLTCYSNRSIDSNTATSAKAISITGTVRIQPFQPFSPVNSYTTALYGGSGYFSATSSLQAPSGASISGTVNFTIEMWINPATFASGYQVIFANDTSGGLSCLINSTGTLSYGRALIAVDGTTTGTVTFNQWNHIAFVRSGTSTSQFVVYINGSAAGSFTNSTSYAAGVVRIGTDGGGSSFPYTGYISNLRVISGTAVYTGAFTPPTLAPLTTAGSTSAASYSSTTNVNTSFTAASTSLLTNFTNAGIYDAAVQNNVITVGDAQASTTITAKWPPTSMKFDGTGDWLTAIDSPTLQLTTNDFTIDGWVYLSAISVAYGIISKGTATTGWSVNVTALNKLQFSYTASNLTGTTTLATGTWYYFAVVRSGSATGNLKVYLNGTVDATSGGAVTDNFNQTSILYVGADRIGGSALNGYLQDIRITKYARTITLPTAAFPTK
jgi:hypothetical protein